MTRQIFAAEINFEDVAHPVREKFNGNEKNIKEILAALKPLVREVFILATRHRFTAYIVHENLNPLTEFFHTEQLRGCVQFYYNSGESVTHLMATASGLLSPVKGESQILSEIARCCQWAAACGCLGLTLDNTLSKAMDIGKAVRTATGIDQFCASVVEAGMDLLYSRLENIHQKYFVVLGTGKLARLAMEYLYKEGIRNVAIADHDPTRALQFAKKYGAKSFHLDQALDYFSDADVIIGASHGALKTDLMTTKRKRKAHSGDNHQNLFILDLGIPPNFDSQWVERNAAEWYNLDDLRRLQPSLLESFGGLEGAWRLVIKASNDFVHLLKLLDHSPILTAYLNRQFIQKNGELKVKPRRTLRNILFFLKADDSTGISQGEYLNAKAHINNHVAEWDGPELVKNIGKIKSFRFFLSDN